MGAFVWLHRDPEQVVASCCSMNLAVNDYACAAYADKRELGARTLDCLARAVVKAMADRARMEAAGGATFVDIRYDELRKDPAACVERAYAAAGLTVSADFRARIAEASTAPKSTTRRHKYTLEEFGLDRGAVRAAFAPYIEAYSV